MYNIQLVLLLLVIGSVLNAFIVAGIIKDNDNDMDCFDHVVQESTTSFTTGEVMQICFKKQTEVTSSFNAIVHKTEKEALPLQTASSRVLQIGNESVDINIYVNVTKDGPVDMDACVSATSACNLRSAVQVCADILYDENSNCTITLPRAETIEIDSSLGELVVLYAKGTMTILGEGSVVVPAGGGATRFLNLTAETLERSQFSVNIHNLTLDGFGGFSTLGGTIYLENLAGGIIQDITCRNSKGSFGGALYMTVSKQLLFQRSSFLNNTAIGNI